MANMTRLILSGHGSSALGFEESGRADIAIDLVSRLVWGPLPSDADLAGILAPRSTQAPGWHWLDYASSAARKKIVGRNFGLIELCQQCETVELWFDSDPNQQLQLVWLLDYFGSHPQIVARLRLRLVDFKLIVATPEQLGGWDVPFVDVTKHELTTASATWQAYRAATPEACFNLLGSDLSPLPLLRPALFDLLEELPSRATEMRLLELIARGYERKNELFYPRELGQRRVFLDQEIGFLLEGLAHGPRPAIAGLDDELRTLEKSNAWGRTEAFRVSRLSLTEFGKAVVAHKEDFSRHNPIDRWWGGTHLTNDRLWRWDPVLTAP
jgi:hypothetical protein